MQLHSKVHSKDLYTLVRIVQSELLQLLSVRLREHVWMCFHQLS